MSESESAARQTFYYCPYPSTMSLLAAFSDVSNVLLRKDSRESGYYLIQEENKREMKKQHGNNYQTICVIEVKIILIMM